MGEYKNWTSAKCWGCKWLYMDYGVGIEFCLCTDECEHCECYEKEGE